MHSATQQYRVTTVLSFTSSMHGVSPTPKPDEAREMLNDMVQVLQAEGRSQEDIDTRLKSIRDMLTATEGAIDDEYVATFRYAKTIQK
jgi:hypothetical protein